ncbi:hypothetical protein Tco_0014155 [Tanacetum coccineum]
MEVDTSDAEAVADVGIYYEVAAHPEDSIDMGVEIAASDVREDDEEFEAEASAADTRDFHYMSEVRIDRITEIETTQRQLETSQLVASRERASLVERIGSLRLEYLKVRAILSIERDRIDILCWHMTLSHEEFRQRIKSKWHHGDNGNGGNGNGGNRNRGNGNPNENGRGDRPVARECTYQDFMKCQPLNFKGTKGVREIMKLMTEVYCPRNETQKMESELWNLTVKKNDLAAYTQRFQEMNRCAPRCLREEERLRIH